MSYNGKDRNSVEYRRLLRAARDYRKQGYNVILHPDARDLPEPLSGCPLDMIAEGKDDVIAVEVRSRPSLTLNGSEDLRRMTELVNQIPGWKFELIVTNPRGSEGS
jgi:hypothetical protein